MSGKKSKNKGKAFEREIANFLSDLYEESFTRVPYSGAFVGGKNAVRKEHLDEAQIRGFKGDIIPPDTWSKLNIECKNYADFTFHALFQQKNIPLLNDWIDQTYDAADEGDFNLIIMKFSRRGKFVMFESKHKLLSDGYCVPYVKDGIAWVFMDFDRFWAINKDGVKKCSES